MFCCQRQSCSSQSGNILHCPSAQFYSAVDTGAASRRPCSFPDGSPDCRAGALAAPSSDRHKPGCRPGAERSGDPSLSAARHPAALPVPSGRSQQSLSTTLSSMTSATRSFSLAFSSSSCFRRLASDRSIPAYLAFSLLNVAGLRPCFRHSSGVGKPASCYLIIPIIAPWGNGFSSSRLLLQVGQTLHQIEGTPRRAGRRLIFLIVSIPSTPATPAQGRDCCATGWSVLDAVPPRQLVTFACCFAALSSASTLGHGPVRPNRFSCDIAPTSVQQFGSPSRCCLNQINGS